MVQIFIIVIVSDTHCLQRFFQIYEKRGGSAIKKSQNSPRKVDYLSSDPIHTAFLVFGIYKNHYLKMGRKKPRSLVASGLFRVGIYFVNTTWLRGWDLNLMSCQILCGEFGFRHLAALTVHRTVIHYRSAVRQTLRAWLSTSELFALRAHNPAVSRGKSTPRITKKKTTRWVVFFLVAGMGFEPHDLRVMSPTSYQAALPRDIKLVPETGLEPVRYSRSTGF